jgi:hypothetical protein
MKISISDSLRKCGLVAIFFAIITSCQDDNDPSSVTAEELRLQSTIATEETNDMVAIAQEAIETSSDVMEIEGITSGRSTESVTSKKGYYKHYGCDPDVTTTYNVDLSHRDTVIYTGTISIDYGDGATCDPKHVRKGKIINTFKYIYPLLNGGAWSSVETITFKEYVSDDKYTNGGIQVTSRKGVKAVKFTLTMIDYSDGLTRQSSARLMLSYHDNNTFKWKDNTITVTGRGSGTTRHGHVYEFFIREDLLYKYSCDKDHRFYPVQGEATGLLNGTEFLMSCGEGECDNIYTMTINGETTTHEFSKEE